MAQAQITGQSPPSKPEPRRISLDEYIRLLDTGPYEVIDGELIQLTPQSMSSNDAAHALYDALVFFVKQHKLGRVRMEATFALEVDPDGNWVTGSLVPDVAFISAEKMREQKSKYAGVNNLRVSPELAVEVVSPTDAYSDVTKKVNRYLGYGVRLVWVVDPQNQTVAIYSPDQPAGHSLSVSDTLTAPDILPGWSMPVAALYASPDEP